METDSEVSGTGWNRREFVAAMGAGAITLRGFDTPVPPPPAGRSLAIKFHGAILVTRGKNGCVEILMPRAEGTGAPDKHPDHDTAHKHYGYLAQVPLPAQDGIKHHLLGRHLSIEASSKPTKLQLTQFIHLDCLVPTATLLPYEKDGLLTDKYASRVTIKGGTLRAVAHERGGVWKIDPNPNECSPPTFKPFTTLLWNTGVPTVTVKGVDEDLQLKQSDGLDFHIGHQPFGPEVWHKPPVVVVKPGFKDRDFKWLYHVLALRHQDGTVGPSRNPLPVPTLVSERYRPMTLDSPTCFGGCWNC